MTDAPATRARRRPCRWCGEPESAHRSPHSACAGYIPIDPTPRGVHRTARLDLKIPDPAGREARWRAMADAEGVSLGELVRRALDAFCDDRGF